MLQDRRWAEIQVFPPYRQGTGSFDGGRITEIKPIGFPGEATAVRRVGPLFYWAWATSHAPARIALHPHRGFEIISYVLKGELGHYDTLGTRSRIGAGGAQVMQTGSGVSHEEETFAGTDFFQIWFEPELSEAIKRAPVYAEFHDADFPVTDQEEVRVKHVIGQAGPISLVADVVMQDVVVAPGASYSVSLPSGKSLALVAVGGAAVLSQDGGVEEALGARDFAMVRAAELQSVSLTAAETEELQVVTVEVPSDPGYALLAK